MSILKKCQHLMFNGNWRFNALPWLYLPLVLSNNFPLNSEYFLFVPSLNVRLYYGVN